MCMYLVSDYGLICVCLFFFQAEDGIRDLVRSRGLGDVYKRQGLISDTYNRPNLLFNFLRDVFVLFQVFTHIIFALSLIHI